MTPQKKSMRRWFAITCLLGQAPTTPYDRESWSNGGLVKTYYYHILGNKHPFTSYFRDFLGTVWVPGF